MSNTIQIYISYVKHIYLKLTSKHCTGKRSLVEKSSAAIQMKLFAQSSHIDLSECESCTKRIVLVDGSSVLSSDSIHWSHTLLASGGFPIIGFDCRTIQVWSSRYVHWACNDLLCNRSQDFAPDGLMPDFKVGATLLPAHCQHLRCDNLILPPDNWGRLSFETECWV